MKIVVDKKNKCGKTIHSMINYKHLKFPSYIHLLDYMIRIEQDVNDRVFPHSKYFYIKSLLQEKFKRSFTIGEVKELLRVSC